MPKMQHEDFPNYTSPAPPQTLSLGVPGPAIGISTALPPKDWPHAPVHRLSENGVYIITAGTLHKRHFFNSSLKRDLLERLILIRAKENGWHLEAWAVFENHYHFMARGNPNSTNMRIFLARLHKESASKVNEMDSQKRREVWHNFWDTRLTHQHSYLARLHYVHCNAVKHGIAQVGNQYPWCSAAWFERTASPAQVKTVYSMKTDKVNVRDDF